LCCITFYVALAFVLLCSAFVLQRFDFAVP
jgi:hypothetical protein